MNTINQFEINIETNLELKVQTASNQIAEVVEDLLDAYVFWTEVNTDSVLLFGGNKDGVNYEGKLNGLTITAKFNDGTSVELTTKINLDKQVAVIHNRNEAYRLANG